MDLGLPADVHTTSRVVQDQHLLVADQPFREDDLLAVAAAQAERDVLTAAHHDPELLYEAPRHLLFAAVTHEAEPAEPWQGGERNILLDTETKDQAIAIAVRRQIGDAAADRGMGLVKRNKAAREPNRARRGAQRPEQAQRQLLAAAPHQAADPEDLSAVQGERHVAIAPGQTQPNHLQQRLSRSVRGLVGAIEGGLHRPPDHQARQLVFIGVPGVQGVNQPAILHHRNPIAQLEDLFQVMRDVDDQAALAHERL